MELRKVLLSLLCSQVATDANTAWPALWTRKPVSDRILTARFTIVVQCYEPMKVSNLGEKDTVYEQPYVVQGWLPKGDTVIRIGDVNVKVGSAWRKDLEALWIAAAKFNIVCTVVFISSSSMLLTVPRMYYARVALTRAAYEVTKCHLLHWGKISKQLEVKRESPPGLHFITNITSFFCRWRSSCCRVRRGCRAPVNPEWNSANPEWRHMDVSDVLDSISFTSSVWSPGNTEDSDLEGTLPNRAQTLSRHVSINSLFTLMLVMSWRFPLLFRQIAP